MQQGHGARKRAASRFLGGRMGTTGLRWVHVLVALGCALIAAVGVGFTAVAGASQPSGTKQVPGLLTSLSKATFLGDASSTRVMSVGIGVQQPNAAAEHALYSSLYDSSSPEYHQFLSTTQFNQRFGVSAATVAKVKSYLTSTGAQITYSSGSGNYFLISATVAQVQKLFDVTIGDYRYGATDFIANNQAASVPAALPIAGTLGLNSYDKMSLDSLTGHQLASAKRTEAAQVTAGRRVIAKAAAVRRASLRTGHLTTAQAGSEMVFTPQDLWGMYDDPGAGALTNSNGTSTPGTLEASSTALGQGQTIGVFGAGEMSSVIPQLRLFEAAEGLPKVPVRTVETEGGPDSAYDGFTPDAVEWYLDSQSSTGMAPDAKQLDLYFSKNFLDADVEDLFSDWASDPNGPREMNASFGECEGNPLNPVTQPTATLPVGAAYGYSLETITEATLEQAAIEGRTLFTSAGDTGSGCPEIAAPIVGGGNGLVIQPVPEVGYPCASEYAVCVGGTVLTSQGTTYPASAERDQETSWTYGGGGTSLFIPKPSFQDGVTAINTNCLTQPDGAPYSTTTPCRGVPDIADMSGNVDGDAYFIYIEGSPSSEGGTSLSSPLMMGQWARIQSAASATTQVHGGIGFADPTIYKVAAGADTCNDGNLDSAEAEATITTPCTDPTYAKDFYDTTESESATDATGTAGAGSQIPPIPGFSNVNVPVGTSNGAYFPAPGWDYDTGWGTLNVANFMQTVDGTTTATDTYTGTEQPALDLSTVTLAGVPDSADDLVSGNDDPGLNLTGATLSATASTVTATLTVPQLSSGVPADDVGGADFYVDWLYNGTVYFATANESPTGAFAYSSGNTSTGFPTDTKNSAATGSANTTAGTITINVPTSEVGAPAECTLLTVPQSFDQGDEGAAGVEDSLGTIDTADGYLGYSVDGGQSDSIEASVIVGGASACGDSAQTFPAATPTPTSTTPSATTPTTSTTPATTPTPTTTTTSTTPSTGTTPVTCQKAKYPTTHITRKAITLTSVKLSGFATAHCPDHITFVGISIAKTVLKKVGHKVKLECRFLTRSHHFSALGSCTPRDYLRAKGAFRWSYSLKLKFAPGVYYLWEHAIDNKRLATKNVIGKHVFIRIMK
jgi:hypothetical protein